MRLAAARISTGVSFFTTQSIQHTDFTMIPSQPDYQQPDPALSRGPRTSDTAAGGPEEDVVSLLTLANVLLRYRRVRGAAPPVFFLLFAFLNPPPAPPLP